MRLRQQRPANRPPLPFAARSAYRDGIAAAARYGDSHAGQEIAGAPART